MGHVIRAERHPKVSEIRIQSLSALQTREPQGNSHAAQISRLRVSRYKWM